MNKRWVTIFWFPLGHLLSFKVKRLVKRFKTYDWRLSTKMNPTFTCWIYFCQVRILLVPTWCTVVLQMPESATGLQNMPMDSLQNLSHLLFWSYKIRQTVQKLWLMTVNQKVPTQQNKIPPLEFFLLSEMFWSGSHSVHYSAINARISYRSAEHVNGFLAKFWVIYSFEVKRSENWFKSFDCQPKYSHSTKKIALVEIFLLNEIFLASSRCNVVQQMLESVTGLQSIPMDHCKILSHLLFWR